LAVAVHGCVPTAGKKPAFMLQNMFKRTSLGPYSKKENCEREFDGDNWVALAAGYGSTVLVNTSTE
jgi:hypothetical protein